MLERVDGEATEWEMGELGEEVAPVQEGSLISGREVEINTRK